MNRATRKAAMSLFNRKSRQLASAQLSARAKTLTLVEFLNSFTPTEYRELTFFNGDPIQFWEVHHVQPTR